MHESVEIARQNVARCRTGAPPGQLAEALEDLSSALLKEADLAGAATALEEAAGLWATARSGYRQGSCLLLAASTRRLAGDLQMAALDLQNGLNADLPDQIRSGFRMEWCEQELAQQRFDSARDGFTELLITVDLEPLQRARLHERRAAASAACGKDVEAAQDFLVSSTIFREQGFADDAEAAALAAAALLATADPEAAEFILTEINATVPASGSAAARRGMVGGRIARQNGADALALKRFDEARQGALDQLDSITYYTAAVEAALAAEALGDLETAYARLATAWTTLADLLGSDQANQMVRPVLQAFFERVGKERFAHVKQQYEEKQREKKASSGLRSDPQ